MKNWPCCLFAAFGLVACGGDKDPAENQNNSSVSQSVTSSSSSSSIPESPLVGAWLLTRYRINGTAYEEVLDPYYADIDVPGSLELSAGCGSVGFNWSVGSEPLDVSRVVSENYECDNDVDALRFIEWIGESKTITLNEENKLLINGNGFNLVFEKYPVVCASPVAWPENETFSPDVEVQFSSIDAANKGLKEFIVNHNDFSIRSWPEICPVKDIETIGVRLSLKTLNQLRCTIGVIGFAFVNQNGVEQ